MDRQTTKNMRESTNKERAIVQLVTDELKSDSISHVIESFSASESLKHIGFESEKIFAQNYAEVISRSKARQLIRTLVAQEIANTILPLIPKNRQRKTIRELGFFTLSECARKMGCSKQNLHQRQILDEKIFFDRKWWYKPALMSDVGECIYTECYRSNS